MTRHDQFIPTQTTERTCDACGATVPASAQYCPSCERFVRAPEPPATNKLAPRMLVVALFGAVLGFVAGVSWIHLCLAGSKMLENAMPFVGAALCAAAGGSRKSVQTGALAVLGSAVGVFLLGRLYVFMVH